MDRTDEFFDLTVNLEGGFSDRAEDNGGKTKYGITQTTLNNYDAKHNAPVRNVKDISVEDAKDIYIEFYYLPVRSNPDKEIHFNFVDLAYNSGNGRYKQMRNEVGDNPTVHDIYSWRTQFYISLNQPANIKGWENRLTRIQTYFKDNKENV